MLADEPVAADSFTEPELTVDVLVCPTCHRLALTGELDMCSVGLLRDAVENALDDGDSVLLDLTNLSFCDVTGVNGLLAARARARTRGRWLRLAGVPPFVQYVLRLTSAGDLMDGTAEECSGAPDAPDVAARLVS